MVVCIAIGLFRFGARVREVVRAYRLRGTHATPVSALSEASGRIFVTGVARRADRTAVRRSTPAAALSTLLGPFVLGALAVLTVDI
jgi:hypothetical protein